MLTYTWRPYAHLTLDQLYTILSLRSDIFVVEQNCPYPDPDGQDPNAIHLLVEENKSLIGYLRLFTPTKDQNFITFGRVLIAKKYRQNGYGKSLINELLSYCANHYPNVMIQCSAQYYLKNFYENLGFNTVGDIYQEDGIPHIRMQK